MSKVKKTRILAAAREFNVGKDTAVEFLKGKGFEIDDSRPDPKISAEMYEALQMEFAADKAIKKKSDSIELPKGGVKAAETETKPKAEAPKEEVVKEEKPKEEKPAPAPKEEPKVEKETPQKEEVKEEPEPKKEEKKEEVATKAKEAVEEKAKETVKAPKEEVVKEEKVEAPKEEEKKVAKTEEKPKAETKKTEKVEKVEKASTEKVESKEEESVKHIETKAPTLDGPTVVGKIDLSENKPTKKAKTTATAKKAEKKKTEKKEETKPVKKTAKKTAKKVAEKPVKKPAKKVNPPAAETEEPEHISLSAPKLEGPTIVGKIELPVESKPASRKDRRKRKRIPVDKAGTPTKQGGQRGGGQQRGGRADNAKGGQRRRDNRRGPKRAKTANVPQEIDAKEIQEKIRETQARMAGGFSQRGGRGGGRTRRTRREEAEKRAQENVVSETKTIQVTEFISVSEFAALLDVSFADIISKCMNLGVMVSINQRLDAEIIELVAGEFNTEIEFISLEATATEDEEIVDAPEDLEERAPIVTIMGHVDHGKTSLLDYIRNATVVAGEAGGITQHIGAYKVTTKDGSQIAFLDTPGHEAFTAMRARGAKVADVAIIVVAADDAIMPQTKEAISHAQAADLPMIFAINKIDKETANPQKIKEQLSQMNILVEDWGGTFQSQEISAKKGINIDELLEKVLLESEMLELTANPDREASGSVIEAELDKGRGYVSTMLVQNGTLRTGDMIVSGQYFGKVRAMVNERGKRVDEAGPSTPVQVLGLNGAPQAGEGFRVYEDESEAKNVATHRAQILREQGLRTRKHITLDEIGRRLALGTFKELNVIIKADFDGSAEALSDSLQKLSTEEIVVNVVLKGVGQITESDVNLASASDAVIIGFQVRPSVQAAQLANEENIEIRNYSVIYDAIEEIKSAMEGMLEPKFEKKVVGNIEVRETYKVSAVGTIAGCYVMDGKFTRNTQVNIIREGIVIHTGELASLKRFKDDVKEVAAGYECGLSIKNYNNIEVGDIIEGFEEVEIKRKL